MSCRYIDHSADTGIVAEAGVITMPKGCASLAEEAPGAYRDAAEVVDVCQRAGLTTRVARMRPLAVVKGQVDDQSRILEIAVTSNGHHNLDAW